MEKRDKIVEILKETESEWHKTEFDPIDGVTFSHIAYIKLADALIAANIGDVTEWKERAKKHRVQVLPDETIKQLYSDEEVEQIVKERDSKEEAYNKCYFDYKYWKDKAKEYKNRAERAEKERDDWQLIARKIAIMQTYTDMCYGCSAAESGFCDYYGDNTIKLGSKNCVDAIIKQAKVEINEDKKTEV